MQDAPATADQLAEYLNGEFPHCFMDGFQDTVADAIMEAFDVALTGQEAAMAERNAEATYYMSVSDIGELFGVGAHTVGQWMHRYSPDRSAEAIAKAPTMPQPDVYIGLGNRPIAGWSSSREAELRAWKASLPGPGAGGGRPRNTPVSG
jgi:hypothetical protein